MRFKKIQPSLSHIPGEIRKNAAENDVTIHDDWTDLDLLNLWDNMFHDRLLIEASLSMSPADALDERNLFDPQK